MTAFLVKLKIYKIDNFKKKTIKESSNNMRLHSPYYISPYYNILHNFHVKALDIVCLEEGSSN